MCVFEFIYFARPDSTIDGLNVMRVRRAMGRELARESPVEADIVLPVPDSGIAGGHLVMPENWVCFFDMGLMKIVILVGLLFVQNKVNAVWQYV